MDYTVWTIKSSVFELEKRQSKDALFTVGNGYFGIRGFFEEDNDVPVGNGGIYVAGIVGKGEHLTFSNNSRELCNIANVLRLKISVNGEKIDGVKSISDFSRTLDMKNAVYTRRYTYNDCADFEFSRFADMADVNRIGQCVIVKAKKDSTVIDLSALLDTDVVNLNKVSCEPLPIQPGRNHIVNRKISVSSIVTTLDDEDSTKLFAAHKVVATVNGKTLDYATVETEYTGGYSYNVKLNIGDTLCLKRIISVYTNKYDECPEDKINVFLEDKTDYDDVFFAHCKAWEKRWSTADIQIETDTDDDTAVRYNLFELMCSCPMHTDKVSIGARGLTGEMYEGCVFWDNETFQLPFFTYSDPDSARRLLSFRYHTLNEACVYAKQLRIEGGAQFPWQVSEKGIEETESTAGLFAVHITADIVYAIREYIKITGDNEFLWSKGAEILIQTARFWEKRSILSEFDGYYHIMAVRGPNEYSPIVDDNAFTNCMAAENLKFAVDTVNKMKSEQPRLFEKLKEKISFNESETEKWLDIANNYYICYDEKNKIVAEYPTYFNRYPFDIKKYKPTAKRVLESGTHYDYLYYYQITKQADTVLLMCLLPELFTEEEKKAAYEYYEPRTVHDSSLSYSPHAWLAARLGKIDEAYKYFKQCAYLDINDLKLNTISGIHFANFGGTWLSAIFGFAGVFFDGDTLYINPKLPDAWKSMKFSLICKGTVVKINICGSSAEVLCEKQESDLNIVVNGKEI